MPSRASAAARFAVTVDLPTPPLPEPMQITFLTAASAPVGRPSRRPRRCCRPVFSCWLRTSKPTFTCCTPSSARTAVTTPFWKCDRIGHPGVVSDTTTSTRPSSGCSIERTMPRSTMLWRSSGSMTTLRAARISSCVGMRLILAEAQKKPAGPRRTPPAEGGEILHCQAGYEARQLFPGRALRRPGVKSMALDQVRSGRPEVLGGLGDARLDALGRALELTGADVARGDLDRGLEVARVALHEALDLGATLAQAALELSAGPLELTLELVARGVAATLVPLEVLGDLTRGGGALHVRLDRLDHVVAGDQGGADRDQHCTLSLGGDGLEHGLLRLRGVLHRVRGVLRRRLCRRRCAASRPAGRAGAARGGLGLTGRGGTLGRRAALRGSALALSGAAAGRAAALAGRARAGRVAAGAAVGAASGAAGAATSVAAGAAAARAAGGVLGSHWWRSLLRVLERFASSCKEITSKELTESVAANTRS